MELFTRIRAGARLSLPSCWPSPVCAGHAGTIVETGTAEAAPIRAITSSANGSIAIFGAYVRNLRADRTHRVGFGMAAMAGVRSSLQSCRSIRHGYPARRLQRPGRNLARLGHPAQRARGVRHRIDRAMCCARAVCTSSIPAPMRSCSAPASSAQPASRPFTWSDASGDPQLFEKLLRLGLGRFRQRRQPHLLNGDAVPEPMTLVLMLAGLLGVAFLARGRSASPVALGLIPATPGPRR